MNIRLIATDMDGTLLDSQKRLPADFGTWVLAHPEIRVAIASGRQYYALKRDFEALEDHLIFIAENGGLVFEKGKVIHCDPMKPELVRECVSLFAQIPDAFPVICGAASAYMIRPTRQDWEVTGMYYERMQGMDSLKEILAADTIVKVALYVFDFAAEQKMPLFRKLADKVDVVLSGDSWIDFANFTTNKGSAFTAVMERYGIRREETMAFGDYLNDYTLLQSSGESYCMANGHPKLKAIAKHIAPSNDEDGVMSILRTL